MLISRTCINYTKKSADNIFWAKVYFWLALLSVHALINKICIITDKINRNKDKVRGIMSYFYFYSILQRYFNIFKLIY